MARRVVFTSGSFDSLNVHDLRALQRARAQGELLVVGVNGDPSTGPQRAEMLAALRFVDYVTLFPERGAAQGDSRTAPGHRRLAFVVNRSRYAAREAIL